MYELKKQKTINPVSCYLSWLTSLIDKTEKYNENKSRKVKCMIPVPAAAMKITRFRWHIYHLTWVHQIRNICVSSQDQCYFISTGLINPDPAARQLKPVGMSYWSYSSCSRLFPGHHFPSTNRISSTIHTVNHYLSNIFPETILFLLLTFLFLLMVIRSIPVEMTDLSTNVSSS